MQLGSDYHNLVLNPQLQHTVAPMSIFLGFWLLSLIFSRLVLPWLLRYSARTSTKLDEQILTAFAKPIRTLIFIVGTYLTLLYLPLPSAVDLWLAKIFRSLLIIMLAWGAHLMAGADSILSAGIKEKLKVDRVLIPSFSKAVQFIIWALALVLVAHEWDYDVNGFIAGLGLGGLAFALAAKDMLANIFGGIVIIMEKPFALGDWVETPSVEGNVEEISFRSTRFRTFTQALVTVPNSTLANEAITNWSRMGKRRAKFTLSIDYAGPREKIEKFIQEIRAMLQSHPGIIPDNSLVCLESINDNSLDILVQYFSLTTNSTDYLALKEQVNYRIMDIMAQQKVALAAPGRIVYSENAPIAKIVDKSPC